MTNNLITLQGRETLNYDCPARIKTEKGSHQRSEPNAIVQRLNDGKPPWRRKKRREICAQGAQAMATPVERSKLIEA